MKLGWGCEREMSDACVQKCTASAVHYCQVLLCSCRTHQADRVVDETYDAAMGMKEAEAEVWWGWRRLTCRYTLMRNGANNI